MAPNTNPIVPWLVALIAVVFGVLSAEIAMYFSPPPYGRQIGPNYLNLAFGSACAFAFVAGFLGPRAPWRWCLLIAWSHALWLPLFRPYDAAARTWKSDSPLSLLADPALWRIGGFMVVASTAFCLPGIPFAYAGAWIRRRLQRG